MISVFYYNQKEFPDSWFNYYLKFLPPSFLPDILRYREFKDKKARLLARLMVLYALKMDNAEHLIHKWTVTDFQKPHIPTWKNFNISHSGNWVILLCSNNKIGVDVEAVDLRPHHDIVTLLHTNEREYVNNAKDKTAAFYTIWTRKEALLKATGTGLINKLDAFNCVQPEMMYNEVLWHFSHIALNADHVCTACSETEGPQFKMCLFNPKYIIV